MTKSILASGSERTCKSDMLGRTNNGGHDVSWRVLSRSVLSLWRFLDSVPGDRMEYMHDEFLLDRVQTSCFVFVCLVVSFSRIMKLWNNVEI
jgi:hypothetical protein